MYGIIYKATSPTGLVYIGQSTRPLPQRIREHKRKAAQGKRWGAFMAALVDCGFLSFAWEQIDTAETPEELDAKEKQWIAFYQSDDPVRGYNRTPGSAGWSPSKETRQKISSALKGRPSPLRGVPKSAETRKKMSKSSKGKRHSAETRQKLRDIQAGKYAGEENPFYGQRHTPETREKMREAWKRRGARITLGI
jgi:group I intron endonuclease